MVVVAVENTGSNNENRPEVRLGMMVRPLASLITGITGIK